MRTTSRSVFVLVAVLLLAVAAACVAATWLAGPAQAAPGSIVWKKTVNSTGTEDWLWYSAQGPGGSLYAAGNAGSYPHSSMWVVRYSSTGKQLWSRTWTPDPTHYTYAAGVLADSAGNVYVYGSTRPETSNPRDAVVLKYDRRGTLKWAARWRDGIDWEEAQALGLDGDREVYVAGGDNVAGGNEVYVLKLDPATGARVWRCDWQGGGYANAGALYVSRTGTCYLAGSTLTPGPGQMQKAYLLKVRAGGTVAWDRSWGDETAGPDGWWRVARAGKGIVVGGSTEDGTDSDLVVARFTTAGTRSWLRTWGSKADGDETLQDLAVGPDASVWVCGHGKAEEGVRTPVVKWSAAGKRQFARLAGGGTPGVALERVVVDTGGNAYLGGYGLRAQGTWDGYVTKYSARGRSLWKRYVGAAGVQDGVNSIRLGPSGTLYAAGEADYLGADPAGLIAKLRR